MKKMFKKKAPAARLPRQGEQLNFTEAPRNLLNYGTSDDLLYESTLDTEEPPVQELYSSHVAPPQGQQQIPQAPPAPPAPPKLRTKVGIRTLGEPDYDETLNPIMALRPLRSKKAVKSNAYKSRELLSLLQNDDGATEKQMDIRDPMHSVDRPSKLIHASDLLVGKRQLKRRGPAAESNPISLDRKDLFDAFEIHDYFPLLYCKSFLQTQMAAGEIVSLNFAGVDQLTDALFYILLAGNMQLVNLKHIVCAGCVHLTDVGVGWIRKLSPYLKSVNLNGCSQLTERALHTLLSSPTQPTDIEMMATNVGVGCKDTDDTGYKLTGCPLVSYFGPDCTQNIPLDCHKVVILRDETLPISVGGFITGQSGSFPENSRVACWPGWRPKSSSHSFNMFEVRATDGMADLVLSDGCVVLLPYDGSTSDIEAVTRSLFVKSMKVACKYSDCVFIVVGVGVHPKDPAKTLQSKTVMEALQAKIKELTDTMDKEITKLFRWKWVIDSFLFDTQIYFTQWVKQFESLKKKQMMHFSLTKNGQTSKLEQKLKAAADLIGTAQPFYQTISPELLSISSVLARTPLQSVTSAYACISPDICVRLHPTYALPHVSKGLEILHAKGQVLYFKDTDDNGLVTGDPEEFLKGVNSLLTTSAPLASIPCLEAGSPCWKEEDLIGSLGGESSGQKTKNILKVLEGKGCILPIFEEGMLDGGSPDSPVYVCLDLLPARAPGHLSLLWPPELPATEVETDRFYTFIPELPTSLLSTFFRHLNKLYQFRVLWRCGVLIQHGPVDILVRQSWDDKGCPVIAVSCRTFRYENSSTKHGGSALYTSLNTVTRVLDFVIRQYEVFAKITVPCPTCVPSRDLNIMLQRDKCHQFHSVAFTSGVHCKREGPSSKAFDSSEIFGPVRRTDSLVPRHVDWYLDQTKDSFVQNSRCFHCNRVARDGDGKTAAQCPGCGTCNNCVKFLAEVEKTLHPGFAQARGSKSSICATNLKNSTVYIHRSMEPTLFNLIDICLFRGNTLVIGLLLWKLGMTLKFHLATGCVTGPGQGKSETNDRWLCREGDRVVISVKQGKTWAEFVIVCCVNGEEIWRRSVERQSIMPQFSSADTFLGFFLHTPGVKEYWQTEQDRLSEKMVLEYSGKDEIVTARVTGNNGKVVSLLTQSKESQVSGSRSMTTLNWQGDLSNAVTVELTSVYLHPVGYAKAMGETLNGKTVEEQPDVYDYKQQDGVTFAPVWLFNEAQRGYVQQLPGMDKSPPTKPCLLHTTPAAIQCGITQFVPRLETALYKTGGIDYTGAAMLLLPSKLRTETIQWPARHLIGNSDSFLCHSLCYIRAECEDMLSLMPATQDLDTRNPYWQLHMVNSRGFPLPSGDNQDYLPLLAAWHALLSSEQLELPDSTDQIFQVDETLTRKQMKQAVVDYVKWQSCRLFVNSFGENLKLKPGFFEDEEMLSESAEFLRAHTAEHVEASGLEEFVTLLSQGTIYMCPAHIAAQQIHTGLEHFPTADFSDYKTFITSLKIEGHNFETLPDNFFSEFCSLLDLQLSTNYLVALPKGAGRCKTLCHLKLKDNHLQTLPDDLAECQKLRLLEISGNPMDEIPPVVSKIKSLERLYISNMQLSHLPEDIGSLSKLVVLNASGNCLSRLPESFSQLKKLKQLYLNGIPWMPVKPNTLLSKEHFEKFLDKHANLLDWLEDHDHDKAVLYEQFDEDQNGTLDAQEVSKLNATLFMVFPRIGHKGKQPPDDETYSGFPEEILGLRSLEYLSVQYQGLVSLPESISTLTKLNSINLSHNPYLTTVAAAAGNLPLKMLSLEDCPSLKTPPKEIRARGFASTYAYLRRLLSGSVECHRTKLMFVGLGGAGKTSLSRALLSGNLKTEVSASEAITDGIDISTWTVKSGEDHISYSVWDFAGQTVYYNTHQFFLSDRAVYLLLWNIRLGYEHAGLDFWLSSISVHAPKAPIFVVGTHLDKVSKTEIPMAEMRQKFPQIAGFHFISSHTGKGVLELQQNMFETTLQQPYMGEKIPGVWLNFERKILANQSRESVVKYSEIEQMSAEAGIFDQAEIAQAVQFLHDLGSLQHFTNEFLRSYVVINPQWIVDVMTCVVSVKDSPILDGRFRHADIGRVWKDYPAELHQWLLRLTEEFDLTFPIADQELNLVPCLLPEVQPQVDWKELDRGSSERETKMVYKFSYLPAGLFNRGQVRLYQFSDSSVIWKRGSLLRKNGHAALLQQTQESELVVRVQGPRPENILFLIHEVFEGLIAESFHGVTYDFLVPCPDCLKAASREPHVFAASTVRRASELKAPFLQCMKYFHTISVIDLLASMPPDNNTDYDIHLVSAVRGLKDLKKDLAADIFISYSPENNSPKLIGPDKVFSDLQEAGYKCWYPKGGRLKNVDQMAKALMDCEVFVALISNEYVHDKHCCDIFKFARLILKKPIILVVVGTGFEWRESKLGILLADDLFVNMQKKDQYSSKLAELLTLIRERSTVDGQPSEHPPCFISYSWQNSAIAVSKGTRQTAGALGYGDPRTVKEQLEKAGVQCWIDVERVGLNGLFEDIAEGLLNAKVMVACVSDEYAASHNCQVEFRFAANVLKLPIVLAVMGTGNAWRAKEVGILSLEYPLVSFQEKSETAHQKLLTLVNERLKDQPEQSPERQKKQKNKVNETHKNMSFQELYELAQRKFLRQVAHYAEKQETLYPRLFVADFVSQSADEDGENKEKVGEKPKKQLHRMKSKASLASLDMADTEHHEDFHRKKYCFYILCEHEEGWHSCAEPLPATDLFGQAKLEKYSPYLTRITTILRYNRQIMLNCMAGHDGESYLHWLEQNPQAAESDFQSTYHDFRQEIMSADENSLMGKLSRCHLPNGKTIWLCEEHQKASRVTVLNNDFTGVATGVAEATTENLMLDYLGDLDTEAVMSQFGPRGERKRKSIKRRQAEQKNYVPAQKPRRNKKQKSAASTNGEVTNEIIDNEAQTISEVGQNADPQVERNNAKPKEDNSVKEAAPQKGEQSVDSRTDTSETYKTFSGTELPAETKQAGEQVDQSQNKSSATQQLLTQTSTPSQLPTSSQEIKPKPDTEVDGAAENTVPRNPDITPSNQQEQTENTEAAITSFQTGKRVNKSSACSTM